MKKKNNNGKNRKITVAAETPDITEAVTGEFKILDLDAAPAEQGAAPPTPTSEVPAVHVPARTSHVAAAVHLNGASVSNAEGARAGEGAQAAFWLNHLESEIGRLHEKWHGIDAEFKAREALIAELREIIQARDAAVEKLEAEARRAGDALRGAEERIASKDAEIAALTAEQRARDERIASLLTSGAAQDGRERALERQVAAVQADLARVNAQLRQIEGTAAGLAKHNEDLAADKRGLQVKIQDLETYIDGRKQSWSDLNQRLDEHKGSLAAMEKTIGERESALERHDHEKQQLAARILDLERQCAELTGRRKEREAAYEELQVKLERHIEVTEQLKAEHAKSTKETEQTVTNAANGQKLIESLERGVALRDESLAALTAELAQKQAAVAELSAAQDQLVRRIGELDKGMEERSEQLQRLHDDASSARNTIARLEDEAAKVAAARDRAVAEAERANAELAAQQHLIASLETELRAKQVTSDLLERNVGRLTDLGASLAALDRQMESRDETPSVEPRDFAATVASDSEPSSEASGEMLPIEIFMQPPGAKTVLDIGSPDERKFIMLTGGGESLDYALVKQEMTIGRGRDSDIRIASQFISRIHARVNTRGGATVIEDAGSKNGILVNSQRVKRRVLRNGDIVSLGGELDMKFVDASH